MSKTLTIILGAIGSLIANVIWLLVNKAILKLGIISIIVLIILIAFEFAFIYHKIKQKNGLQKILTQHKQERSDKEIELSKSQNSKASICDFLDDIEKRFNEIKLFHLPKPVPLKDQYIPIQVTLERKFRHDIETFTGYIESDDESRQAYAYRGIDCESEPTQISWEEARKKYKKIMVLADPGMGKSTLLKMEALSNAHCERKKLSNGEITIDDVNFPILLRLYDLSERAEEVFDAVIALVQRDYPKTSKDIIDLLRKKLEDGKCFLLLDALDEVPGERRNELSQKLDRFARNYDCPIICTSRIVGYGGSFLTDLKEVEIVPFSQKQTQKYINTWFNLADIKDDSVSADGLIRELEDKPQVQGLAQNPLLLSLICSLYQEKKISLPARRCEIYEKAVDYILGEWREKKKPQPKGREIAKRRLLEYLAYLFTCESKEIFTSDEIFNKILNYPQFDRIFRNDDINILIDELSSDDGIIPKADKESDRYMFLHRTFQEYLTASYMKRNNGIELAKEHFWDYDWHETLSLLAGLMDDPIPLLQTIMDEKDDIFFSMLLLACRCLTECKEISHGLTADIMERTYDLWKNPLHRYFISSIVVILGRVNRIMLDNLIKALGHVDSYVRSSAADVLGKIGSEVAVNALVKVMNDDKDSSVRGNAASALGNIGSEKAVPALIKVMNDDKDSNVRGNAASALGNIGSEKAVPALIKTLEDENSNVKRYAADALGNIGSDMAVDALINALDHKDSYVRWCAAYALGNIGSDMAVDALINALDHKDSDVRRRAADALGNTGSDKAVDALIKALDHENSDVRRCAADALRWIDSKKVIKPLINALNDCDKLVRIDAAIALGWMGSDIGVDFLIDVLSNEEDYEIKISLIEAIGEIYSQKFEAALIEILRDKDKFISRKAAYILGEMGYDEAEDVLIESLKDDKEQGNYVRCKAAHALGMIGSERAINILINFLNDKDKSTIWTKPKESEISKIEDIMVRWRIINTLGEIGSYKALDTLIKSVNDKDYRIKSSAAYALAKIGGKQVADILINIINDEDIRVRDSAAFALGNIGTSEILMKLISNPEIDIYDSDIFYLARKLAIRFSTSEAKRKGKLDFIPVYPELVKGKK